MASAGTVFNQQHFVNEEHTGALAWLWSLLHKISAVTPCEMILSVCIITWKLSGVHINNIYLQSCLKVPQD